MSPDAPARARVLAKLAATIVLAGALVAGMLLPFVGGTGLAARNSASLLDALPDALTDETPPGNTRVLAADGSLITMFYRNNRTPVASDRIAPVMKQALVAIEDARFEEHNGLDVQGTLRALATNVAAGAVREGGSTLTQQLVKQTLVQTADTPEERLAATEESVGRKLREARMALALEDEYSKDEVLTRYLNLVYFGQGAYGVQAAAQRYFSVDAADLTLPQAAMLAGLVQSPSIDDPITNPDNARERRNVVLRSMLGQGMVTEAEVAEISERPVEVVPGANPANGCIDATIGGFFCAFVQQYLTQRLGIPQSVLDDGGLTIQTTLRPDVQTAGVQAVLDTVPQGDPLVATYTVVEPDTGHVLAMANNRRFGCEGPECESVNFNVVPSKGAGSTFKVFTAAAAVERGFGPGHTITTSEPYLSRVYRDWDAERGVPKPYAVQNVGNGYPSTLDMERALYLSSNTYFLALEDQLGSVEGPVRMAQRLGMSFDAANQYPADTIIEENRGSFTFGTDATSPLDLANSMATLAANGTRCEPTPVTAVLDRAGQPLTGEDGQPVLPGDACTPDAVPAEVAATMTAMLRKDVEPGFPGQTGARAYVPGHQIAGKTGTNQNRDSVAFVGYTPQYAASVMVFSPLQNQDVGGFGGALGAGIWGDAMRPILSAQAPVPFPEPPAPPVADPAPAEPPAPAPSAEEQTRADGPPADSGAGRGGGDGNGWTGGGPRSRNGNG